MRRLSRPGRVDRTTALLLVALGSACHSNPSELASDAAAPSASTTAAAAPTASERGEGDEIRPVYPIDGAPPSPLAERYCAAVVERPRARREACCPGAASFAEIGECVRTLSAALRSGAVTIDAGDLDACASAVENSTEGCGWVTSVGSPTIEACLGIIHGTIANGRACRSNLECGEGMRCRGLGATRAGKCAEPLPANRSCNVSTDSLAAFTAQSDYEARHPECAGTCSRRRCVDAVPIGGACTTSPECGVRAACVSGKCAKPPRTGDACDDRCAGGGRCAKHRCVAPKAEGERCEDDAECGARCERSDGGKLGLCARECPSFLKPRSK